MGPRRDRAEITRSGGDAPRAAADADAGYMRGSRRMAASKSDLEQRRPTIGDGVPLTRARSATNDSVIGHTLIQPYAGRFRGPITDQH